MSPAMTRYLVLATLLSLAYFALAKDGDQKGPSADNQELDESENKTGQRRRPSARGPTATKKRNFYDYKVKTITGKDMELDEFRGQVLLVVNVASQCGFTDSHYKALVRLHQALSPTGKFTVLGFPCNQFGMQEPDPENKILDFVKTTYNVQFPMFSKVNVIEPHVHEVFRYLQEKTGKIPNWNFWKYLVNHKGDVIGVYPPWMDLVEITKDVRGAVNDAVQADPHDKQRASGPPQQEHADYGDGAGGGLNIWSEGMPAAKKSVDDLLDGPGIPGSHQHGERAGSKPAMVPLEETTDSPVRLEKPGSLHGAKDEKVLKPGLHPAIHDDL